MVVKANMNKFVRESKLFGPIKYVRREFIRGRHWKGIIKNMEQQSHKSYVQAQNLIPYLSKPGIAFSFDDSFRVNDWHKYGKDLFGYYDVKVTFNINAIHHFEGKREHTQEEIDFLIELQSNGHEIAHHGFRHRLAAKYSNEVGISRWVEDEIVPLFEWMERQSHSKTKEKFKKSVAFAFPGSAYNERTISALVFQYYKIVRGHLSEHNSTLLGHTGFAPSICIDRNHLSNLRYIKKTIKIARQTGRNLILMCHSILPDDVLWENFGWGDEAKDAGEYRISPKTIQAIIDEAKKNDMEFYTTAEMAGVATFIDPNLEKCVREQISNPFSKWISISELSLIKELDLSDRNISNLGGIEYFLNLEKLNISNNNLTDLRLLEKLPKLKSLENRNDSVLTIS